MDPDERRRVAAAQRTILLAITRGADREQTFRHQPLLIKIGIARGAVVNCQIHPLLVKIHHPGAHAKLQIQSRPLRLKARQTRHQPQMGQRRRNTNMQCAAQILIANILNFIVNRPQRMA